MAARGSRFAWADTSLFDNMPRVDDRINAYIGAIVDYVATSTEGWMKQNAPWTDRTSNARNGLRARPGHAKKRHWIYLAHGVAYGIWLEIRWAGRYSILKPGKDYATEQIQRMLQGLLDRMRPGGLR